MSSGPEFEEFARDCVMLARQANSPELREKLFDIAREWMRTAMDREDARNHAKVTTQYAANQQVKVACASPSVEEASDNPCPARVLQLTERLRLDLADAFAR